MAINTRSPYYVSISDASISYATLNLYVWSGALASVPATAQYTLKKSIISTNTKVSFEVAELIRDYIEVTFNGTYSGQAVYVKIDLEAFNSSDVSLETSTNTLFGFDGYSYFEEPTFNVDTNALLISNRTIFTLSDNLFRIPVYSAFAPTLTFYKGNEIISTQIVNTSTDSTEQIKYISVYGSTTDYDTYAERVIESGGVYEGSLCLNNFFDSIDAGVIDKVNVIGTRIGSEIIENGDFATDSIWVKQGTATISGGSANFVGAIGDWAGVSQSVVFEAGKTYIVTLDAVVTSGLGIKVQDSLVDSSIGVITTTGSYTFEHTTATSTTLVIGRKDGASAFNCSVDNVSVKEKVESSDNIIIKTIDECKYEPKKVTFINKFGVLQDMYFFKKSVEKMKVKKESYKANIRNYSNTYSINEHVNRDFNVSGSESITLSSGFLNETYNEVFKQMMLSEKVWITNVLEGVEQVLSINVKTSNITYKTSLNDRLVEYTFDFDNSYNTINNIR